VLLTLGRLSSAERYKGFDEVIEVLPILAQARPDISYLIIGDGDDRQRLLRKANALGIGDRVVFAGYVSEAEKAEYYRLGHAFVMPGRGEGYGIAYLEAAATGLPVLGSTLDASGEVINDLQLGEVVDPTDRLALVGAIHRTLARGRGTIPDRLSECGHEQFAARWHSVLSSVFGAVTEPVHAVSLSEA
jgi:glycosyltransferase involved in cell wall biosynthesis